MVTELDTFQCVEMSIFDTSTLTGSYQGMNLAANYTIFTGNGFQFPIKVLIFYNAGTTAVQISYDGVTNNDIMPGGATRIMDLQANHKDFSSYGAGTLIGRQGQIVYGKGTAGTGNFYIAGYF